MSMNLCLTVDGKTVELWQTPTYITDMCMMTSKGVKSVMSGKQAMRALRIYFEWCKKQDYSLGMKHSIAIFELVTNDDVDFEVYIM